MEIDIRDIPTFYINLKKDKSRNENMIKLLSENSFKNFTRFEAIDQSGVLGVSKSHMVLLKELLKIGDYPFLILEDDVQLMSKNFKINVPFGADALYLGLTQYGRGEDSFDVKSLKISEVSQHTHRVNNMLARHAVLHLSNEYDFHVIKQNKDFLKNPLEGGAGDVMISKIATKYRVYALNNPLFYQNDPKTMEYSNKSIYEMDYTVV